MERIIMVGSRLSNRRIFFGLCFTIFFVVTLTIATADSEPVIKWQKSFGGSDEDLAYSIQQTSDGGYIVAGGSASNDGDLTGNYGDYDYCVVKLDASGNKVWQKSLGGSGNDLAFGIQQTFDGGYIVAGQSTSTDGDVTGNHGGSDYWVVKLDASGNKVWQKSLGGSGNDCAYSVQQTSDGGYIVAGYSGSKDGDVTMNHGGNDYWVVKLDASGNKVWQRCLGGSSDDCAYSVQQTSDGGYIVAGGSNSKDGDMAGNHGDYDYCVVKLDASGNKVWQRCLGGSGFDLAFSVQQTSDGGYIVAGQSTSTDGDVTGNHGANDYWVVKLDASGNKVWQKCLGGSGNDFAYSVQQTSDNGYIVVGWSDSKDDGDVTRIHGGDDYWVVKLDVSGNKVWEKCLGGSSNEQAYSIHQTFDGGYIVSGFSSSNDGDVTGNHMGYDYWVVKLESRQLPVFPGCTKPPQDLDKDGLYEDINGNGKLESADVVVYFKNLQWVKDNGLTAYFDFNHDGRINSADVIKLFKMIHSERKQVRCSLRGLV